MTRLMKTILRPGLVGLALLAVMPSPGRADLTFTVTLNTTPLESEGGSGPFYIDLTLTAGSTVNTAQATINSFSFGTGGSAGSNSTITLTNGAAGSLGSGVTLNDSTNYNDFNQAFTPGSLLTFNVDIATTSISTPIPANFSFSILDGTGNAIATTDPSGASTLLNLDLTGPSPTIHTYSSPSDNLGAPSVSYPGSVPEPASLAMTAIGLVMAGSIARRRWRG
jgi:hypothetical protein